MRQAEAGGPAAAVGGQPRLAGDRVAVAVTVGLFSLLWAVSVTFSHGFLAADGYTHYLYARFAFREPTGLLDVWGRPLCTLLYAVPAVAGGRVGACLTSLLVALGCGAVA